MRLPPRLGVREALEQAMPEFVAEAGAATLNVLLREL